MSQSNSAKKNKQQKLPKKFYQQYLYNAHEPSDYLTGFTAAELEEELLEDGLAMKRQFRHIAQHLRNGYL